MRKQTLHSVAAQTGNSAIDSPADGSEGDIYRQIDLVDCAVFDLIETGQPARCVFPLHP